MNPFWVRSHWWENDISDILFSLKGNSLSQESFTRSLALKVGHFWFQASTFLHCDRSRKSNPLCFSCRLFCILFTCLLVRFVLFTFQHRPILTWARANDIIKTQTENGKVKKWKQNGNGQGKNWQGYWHFFPIFHFPFPYSPFCNIPEQELTLRQSHKWMFFIGGWCIRDQNLG